MALDDRFRAAVEASRGLPTQSNETLLELYGLFKQATAGDCQGARPGFLDPKGRAKYDAWAARKGLATDAAKEAYAALVERLGGDR